MVHLFKVIYITFTPHKKEIAVGENAYIFVRVFSFVYAPFHPWKYLMYNNT